MGYFLVGFSVRELRYKRKKIRQNRKGVINHYTKYRNELYHLTNDGN